MLLAAANKSMFLFLPFFLRFYDYGLDLFLPLTLCYKHEAQCSCVHRLVRGLRVRRKMNVMERGKTGGGGGGDVRSQGETLVAVYKFTLDF